MRKIRFNDFQIDAKKNSLKYSRIFERVLKSGSYILGTELDSFEKEFAHFLGVRYCIGVANGLEAIQISLMSLGILEGDEVITTPISAMATTLAILAVGAKPIFVDVDDSGLLDIDLIEDAITKRTKAVLPVHLYGNCVDLTQLKKICHRNHLKLIEDACQAHGSKFQHRYLGSFGDISAFSFYPTKNLGAYGDGGLIATNSNSLAKICYQIRDYGQKKKYVHERFGLNSRLDELQAALLRFKLRNLDEENKKRQLLSSRYRDNFSKTDEVECLKIRAGVESNNHLFVIKLLKRNLVKIKLKRNGISTLIHYPITIPDQLIFGREYKDRKLMKARSFVKMILSLPLYPDLKFSDIDYISQQVLECI